MLFNMLLNDNFMMKIREEIQFNSNEFMNWEDRNKLLQKNDHFYISANEFLQMKLIKRHHDVSLMSYFVTARTYELMSHKFFWSDMKTLVKEYYLACKIYQDSWVIRIKSHKELTSLSISASSWEQISMNFITDLLMSKSIERMKYDFILIIVNQFSKMMHFIST